MEGEWYYIFAVTAVISCAVVALSTGVEGYMLRTLDGRERIAIIVAALSGMTLTITGVAVFAVVAVLLWMRLRTASVQSAEH